MMRNLKLVFSVLITAYIMLSIFIAGVMFSSQYSKILEPFGDFRIITLEYNFTTTQLYLAITFTMILIAIPLVVIVRKFHIISNVVKIDKL